MSTFLKFFAFLSVALIISACATLSKEECAVANWSDLGQKDGQAGYPLSRLESHADACKSANIFPDRSAYTAGHSVGITNYCTPANGLRIGRSGGNYRNSCPANLEAAFLAPYRAGKDVSRLEKLIDITRRRVDKLTREGLSAKTKPARRDEIRSEISNARLSLFRYEADLRIAQDKYDRIARTI